MNEQERGKVSLYPPPAFASAARDINNLRERDRAGDHESISLFADDVMCYC